MISTKHRSNHSELMDDFDMTGDLLQKTLDQIASINKFLGGNNVTINGIKKLLSRHSKDNTIVIVDLGCGSGDMLRTIAKFCKKNGYTCKLIGIDANAFTLDYARKLSLNYPEISYLNQDILSDSFRGISCDIVLSTLFLHHFTDVEIKSLLLKLQNETRLGIVINDLHRHRLAYYLFKIICYFVNNQMVTNDGLLSILKGFKKKELQQIATQLHIQSTIKWKWAFRYQWIIKK